MVDKITRDYYYNSILNNPRILCRDIITQNEKVSDLIIAYNNMSKEVDWLLEMVKSHRERINQLEARLFVKDHIHYNVDKKP
jgi:hypothetical protein